MDKEKFKAYLRFIKNENCYNERMAKIIANDLHNNKLYNIFDRTLTWGCTSEGRFYWYKMQIKLVVFLLEIHYIEPHYIDALNTKKMLIRYLDKILHNYMSDDCNNCPWFKEAETALIKIRSRK